MAANSNTHWKRWLSDLEINGRDQTIVVNVENPPGWNEIMALTPQKRPGHSRHERAYGAANAIEHGLSVMTRNTRHFRERRARLMNPLVS